MEDELKIFQLMKEIHKENQKKCNKAMAEEGLEITKPQLEILIYLKEHKNQEINAKDIENEFHLANPTVTGFLNRLEKKELIQKKKSIKGSKYKAIEITKKGNQILEKVGQKGFDSTLYALKSLPKEELSALVNTLEKILAKIQNEENK